MTEEIQKAISRLTAKASETKDMDEAMKFSQAALNLAHALATISLVKP